MSLAVAETMSTLIFLRTLLVVMFLHSASGSPHGTTKEVQRPTSPKGISEEMQQLQQLGCKPRLAVVRIAEYIKKDNELLDKDYFPKVVPINRCLPITSFCGNYRLGAPNGTCLSDEKAVKQRNTTVFYYDDAKKILEEVEVSEDTACKCLQP